MKITQECDYAIRAIRFLATTNLSIVEARLIAEAESIPMNFLLKILRKLSKSNIIQSYRGVNGGYKLIVSPKNLTLKDLIEIIDGNIHLNKCTYQSCTMKKNCTIHKEFERIENILNSEFSSKTLQDLLF